MKTERKTQKRKRIHGTRTVCMVVAGFLASAWLLQAVGAFGTDASNANALGAGALNRAFGASAFGASASTAAAFSDVSAEDWYSKFVMELQADEIISGYPDGTFRPKHTVTCGQFLSMALQTADRMGGLNAYEEEGVRTGGHWAQGFYRRALAQEVLLRDELPPAALDRPISREWMAVICSRLLPEDAVSSRQYERAMERISDIEELSPHSYEIVTAYSRGLLSGYTDGTFRPQGNLSRAEAAAVIFQLKHLWTAADGEKGEPQLSYQQGGAQKTQQETSQGGSQAAQGSQQGQQGGSQQSAPQGEPEIFWEKNPADFPVETLAFYYSFEDSQSAAQLKDNIKDRIKENGYPDAEIMADELFQSFERFQKRAAEKRREKKQGLRKEYICGYPVMMEAVGEKISIYIKPKGTETQYWEATPQKATEEFF